MTMVDGAVQELKEMAFWAFINGALLIGSSIVFREVGLSSSFILTIGIGFIGLSVIFAGMSAVVTFRD